MALARRLVATVWVGSLWTTGYVVAPTLFASLADRALAGTIAGSLFRVEAWLSLACALVLVVLLWQRTPGTATFGATGAEPSRRRLLQVVVAMGLCTAIGYFGLQPFMASLRQAVAAGGTMQADARVQFGILHGVASGIYLVQSLLGGWLILRLR